MFKVILLLSFLALGVQSAGVTQTLATFRTSALNEHNKYRKLHSAPAMVLDASLNTLAENWAKTLAKNHEFEHSPKSSRPGIGENIYAASGKVVTGATAVTDWYNEIKKYNFNDPGFSEATGHFTQVVWVGSTKLGVGFATSSTGTTYVVANYGPAGNVKGKFPQNVLKS